MENFWTELTQCGCGPRKLQVAGSSCFLYDEGGDVIIALDVDGCGTHIGVASIRLAG